MEIFIPIIIIFSVLELAQSQQKFAAGNGMCQSRLQPFQCPNNDALACCMYPELFTKKIKRECKNNALQVKSSNGLITYYEDSCFITCLFKNSGFNANTNITSDFFKKAIPAGTEMFRTYLSTADENLERCKYYYGYANRAQEFANLYRRSLNKIDPKRPLCNMKLAAVWDCFFMWLMERCPFLVSKSECDSLQSVMYRCYMWGSE